MARLGKPRHGWEGPEAERAGRERIKSREITLELSPRNPSTSLRSAQDDDGCSSLKLSAENSTGSC